MAEEKSSVKINKNHGGKEFKSFFRLIGQVKPVRKRESQDSENWIDQPFYEQTTTKTNKPRRVLQFNVETAMSNELKVELAGMEMEYVYPYSRKHNKAAKVAWKDRNDKTKYPDETYHQIESDWDKTETISQIIEKDKWVEIKGHFEFDTLTNDEGKENIFKKRIIDNVRVIEDGETIKNGQDEFAYVCDFSSPDFKEVNYFSLQVGIKSTYQDEATKDTKVNGVFLTYGKERSQPKDVELTVYYKEPAEGKKSLADAFATLNRLDFIEVTGQDNNRATFTMVEVEEKLEIDDPFADVDDTEKVKRKKRVVSGDKKGLEITGYIAGSKVNGFLTEAEITKVVDVGTVDISEEDDNPFK